MDIYAVLKRDHARIEALLDALREHAGGAAPLRGSSWRARVTLGRLLDELRVAFREHERAEEGSIFPLLLHDVHSHEEAVRAREEQRDAESLLDELARTDAWDARYARKLTELDSLVRSHFFREQQRLVPRALELLSNDDAHRLARRVANDRGRAGEASSRR